MKLEQLLGEDKDGDVNIVPTGVKLSRAQFNALKEIKDKEETVMADLVRRAIKEFIANQKK